MSKVDDSTITSEIVTLMLSWQLARVNGLSQPAAIKKCARRLRSSTKDNKMFDLCTSISKCNNNTAVVACLSKLADKLQEDGLMFCN